MRIIIFHKILLNILVRGKYCLMNFLKSYGFFSILMFALLYIPSKSQLITSDYSYPVKSLEESIKNYNKSLIRKAELQLSDILKSQTENPNLDKAVILSANIDFLTGNYKIADTRLAEFIKERTNSPFTASASLLRAYISFEQHKYLEASNDFKITVDIAENQFNIRNDNIYKTIAHLALYWGGIAYCQKGKYDDAKPLLQKCYTQYPNGTYSDDAIYTLGLIEEINHNFQTALTYYQTATKKYPKANIYIASRIREINNKLILRDSHSAIDAIEDAQNVLFHIASKDSIGKLYEKQNYIDKSDEDLLYLQGEAYNIAGNYQQALTTFENFLDTYGYSELQVFVKLGAAWALLNMNENKKALNYYNSIIDDEYNKNERAKAIAQLYRTVALKKLARTEEAQKELSALSIQPSYPYIGQALLELGQIYYEYGKFDQARRVLERAERESTVGKISVRIHLLLGESYLELMLWKKAISEFSNAERLALNSSLIFMPKKEWYIAEARLKKGVALVKSHRNAEAIKNLNKYLGNSNKDNKNDEALFWLAEAYYRSDMLNSAAETYGRLLTLYSNSTRKEEALYGQGWSYFRMKKFKYSSAIFNRLVREYPKSKHSLEVLARQADGYYITKKFALASEAYRKAANLAPKTDEGQYCAYQLCHALYRLGSYEKAITSLLSFVRKYPRSAYAPYTLYLIGWIRFQQKDYDEAIDNFKFLIQAYSQHPLVVRAHYAAGDAYYNSSRYEKAIEEYNIIVNQFPSDNLAPDAWRSLQYCYIALGREDEAMQVADSVINQHPNTPFAMELRFKKGDMFYSGNNYKNAIDEYQNFIKSYPDSKKNAEALYWMGKSFINLDEQEKASQTFIKLQDKYPKSDYASLGMLENALMLKNHNIMKADSILKKIEELYPKNASASQAGFERAVIKYDLGDTLSAIDLYKKLSDKYPNSEYSYQAMYRVASYYRNIGINDSARAEYQIIAQNSSDVLLVAESQFRVGELFMRDTLWEKAVEAFTVVREKYAGVETWYPLSLLNLGEAYEKLNDIDAAIQIYKTLLAQRPNDEYGKTVKARLKRLEKTK